jgi:hypothetical protein
LEYRNLPLHAAKRQGSDAAMPDAEQSQRTDRQVADSRRDLPSKHANSSLEFWVQWLADTFFALHSSAWPISAVERTKHRRSWSGEYFVNRYGKLQMTGVLQ